MPGTVLGAADTVVNKTDSVLGFTELNVILRRFYDGRQALLVTKTNIMGNSSEKGVKVVGSEKKR